MIPFTNMILLVSLLTTCVCVHGRRVQGLEEPSTGKSWVSTTNFAFVPEEAFEEYMGQGPGAGSAEFTIWHSFEGDTADDNEESLWLLGYPVRDFSRFDLSVLEKGGSDEDMGNNGLSCSERIEKARIAVRINKNSSELYDHNAYIQDAQSPEDDWKEELEDFKYKFNWHSYINADMLNRNKPRIVYWGFANCKEECTLSPTTAYCGGGISIYYKAHFGQYNYDTKELDEFSFGYHNLLLVTAILLVIYTCGITPSACMVFLSLWAHKRDHITVYLLGVSIIISDLQLLFMVASLGAYAGHGLLEPIGGPLLIGIFLGILSHLCLATLLLSLSGGWTITRRKLRVSGRIRLAIFVTLWITCATGAVIWFAEGQRAGDDAVTGWDGSPPGVMLVILAVVAWARFMRQSSVTMAKFPQHKAFYSRLRILGTQNMLGPAIGAIVSVYTSEMYRFRLFVILSSCGLAVTQIVLLCMYHPRILSGFPFHATVEDMKTYKLKKRSDRIAGLVQRIDGTSGAGADAGAAGAAADGADGGVSTISFTGGARSITNGEESATRALTVDPETGKFRPPSYFDKLQISKLRELSLEVDAAVHHLNEYSVALNEILDEIDTSNVESDAEFTRLVSENSLRDDVHQALHRALAMNSGALRAARGGTAATAASTGSGGRGTHRGGVELPQASSSSSSHPSSGGAWKVAGMASRPRTLSEKEERRRKEVYARAAAGNSSNSGGTQGAYGEETMEGGESDRDGDDDGVDGGDGTPARGRGPSDTAIATPGGRATKSGGGGWKDVSRGYDAVGDRPPSGSDDEEGAPYAYTSIHGPGRESEDALRRQWQGVEQQQLEEERESGPVRGGGGSIKRGVPAPSSAFSPRAPPPSSSGPGAAGDTSPYGALNMANLKEHARNRMLQSAGDGSVIERSSDGEQEEEEDPLMSSMAVHRDHTDDGERRK